MASEAYARLTITSEEYYPEQICEMIGMSCDRGWKTGDLRPKTILVEKSNGWMIQSRGAMIEPIENHVDELLQRLKRATEKIRQLSTSCTVTFTCVIYSEDANPTLYLTVPILVAINEMGAALDIDVYFVRRNLSLQV
jgi:hypothetical protein